MAASRATVTVRSRRVERTQGVVRVSARSRVKFDRVVVQQKTCMTQ